MSTGADADQILGRSWRRIRMLVTPDGVPLRVEVAELTERAAAFTLDFAFIIGVTWLLLLAAFALAFGGIGSITLPAATFAAFIVRNAYFVYFELVRAGVTPGKRIVGLRVIDRHGGALTPAAVVARNLSREMETFFPLAMVLQSPDGIGPGWEVVPVGLWLLLTSALPLTNRDRLRAGDLIGGTIVIAVPKRVLLDELVAERRLFTFSDEQLQRYGILELHVLEDVLRRTGAYGIDPLVRDVAEKIRRKIGWATVVPDANAWMFLRDFYAAQRAFLELRKHLGDERTDKFYRR
ncbi:MAG: RDD family protein [Candidatus Eremiobacteraeota bacterium]|nr:RDD family protein [Candidatus Eremiobacteraeota bacterium]